MADITNPTPSTAPDPAVIALAQSIRDKESGGNYNAVGDNGTSAGAFQWSNNGVAIPKGQAPANFKAGAKQFLGNENAPFTPENQKALAYAQILHDKQAGLNPAQIAAKWNSGKTTGWENHVGTTIINGKTLSYNTPQYVKDVMTSYQKYKGGGATPDPTQSPDPEQTFAQKYGTASTPSPTQGADQESAQGSGALFPAVTGESPATAGVKTLGNVLPSAFNFAKGVVSSLNPVNIAKNIAQIPGAFGDLVNQQGGVGNALKAFGSQVLPTTYQQLVPSAARDLIAGDTAGAQREVTNNPFGSIAPFIFAAEGGAKLADNVASKSAMADYVDNIGENTANRVPIPKPSTVFGDMINKPMSAVTDTLTKPIRAFSNFMADNVPAVGKYAFGQATGLEPSTIDTRINNPGVDMSTVSREGIAQTVKTALDQRAEDLGDTGKGYQGVRAQTTPVNVDSSFLREQIGKSAGVTFEDTGHGRFESEIKASGSSAVRDPADVAKLQKFFDFWQPYFDKGALTPEEYLNMRQDLSDMSKFDNKPGRSGPLEQTAKELRSSLNNEYRPQIKGLAEKDATFSSQKTELDNLRKGILDREGNLNKGAPNAIANSLGKGKASFASQLDEISPGIAKQVQILKMAEDFEHAAGTKVGTYSKAIGTGMAASVFGGGITGIAAGVAEAILASPKVADFFLRKYGENKPMLQAIAAKLRAGVSAVNNLPNSVPSKLQNTTVFGRPQVTQ